jgi:hypothetical protein
VFEARMMIEPYILEKFEGIIDKNALVRLNQNFMDALFASESQGGG